MKNKNKETTNNIYGGQVIKIEDHFEEVKVCGRAVEEAFDICV